MDKIKIAEEKSALKKINGLKSDFKELFNFCEKHEIDHRGHVNNWFKVVCAEMTLEDKLEALTMLFEGYNNFVSQQWEALTTPCEKVLENSERSEAFVATKMSSHHDKNDHSYIDTKDKNIENCSVEAPTSENDLPYESKADAALAFEKEQSGKTCAPPQDQRFDVRKLQFLKIVEAMPNLFQALPQAVNSWSDFMKNLSEMALYIGFQERYLQKCIAKAGRYETAIIVGITAEKALRDPKAIKSLGGYVVKSCDLAASGQFDYVKSIYGLIRNNASLH